MPVSESEYAFHQLAGAIAKFSHASEEFDVLATEIESFFNEDPAPHISRGEFDADSLEWIERFQRQELPLRWGVVLGSCVHNLRSALDHLICQVTLLDGGTMDDCAETQFPIASGSEQQFESVADRRLHACFSAKHRAMVKASQPYHAGDRASNHPLSILADLSNTDKHRFLNTFFSVMDSDPKEILDQLTASYQGEEKPPPVHRWWMVKRGQPLKHDAPWLRIAFDRAVLAEGPAEVQMSGNIRLGVAFGDIGLDARDFKKVGEYVWLVIECFMREFPETKRHD